MTWKGSWADGLAQLQSWQQSGHYQEALPLAEWLNRQPHLTPEAHFQLGLFYQAMGQNPISQQHYEKVLAQIPDHLATLRQLGHLYLTEQQSGQAHQFYQQALNLEPHQPDLWFHVGRLAEEQNDGELAHYCWNQAIQQCPQYLFWQLHRDLMFPAIAPSQSAIEIYITHLRHVLPRYHQRIDLEQYLPVLCRHNINLLFRLNYLGQAEKDLKIKLADAFTVPFSPNLWPLPEAQPHVGFVITRFHEGIFLKAMGGIVTGLSEHQIRVTVICDPAGLALLQAQLGASVTLQAFPYDTLAAMATIRHHHFDLLYWWEAGTDSLNYFWPFFRLAPRQCTSWGNAGTSGIPTMDYFLSAHGLEPPQEESLYRESLIQLHYPPTYYYHVQAPAKTRQYFGLPATGHLYGCLQNLLKIHPEFDCALQQLLRADPEGYLVILNSGKPSWDHALKNRWETSLGPFKQQVLWLPEQPKDDFFALIQQMDVMLDPFYFGAGSTAYEVFSLGVPWITWEGPWLRSRIVATCYRQMGMVDMVATHQHQYVTLAQKLGSDTHYNHLIRSQIRKNNHYILENKAVIADFATWVYQTIYP